MVYEGYLEFCHERRSDEVHKYVASNVFDDAESVGLEDCGARLRGLIEASTDDQRQSKHLMAEPARLAAHLL